MVLSLRRRKIAPMRRRDFDRANQHEAAVATGAPGDDYLVEGEEQPYRPSAISQAAQLLQMVMIGVIAVLSLAIFWLVGLMLNIL